MLARIDLFTRSGSCSTRTFILVMGFLLSGWRMNLNGTRANTISEALATSVYHTFTSSTRKSIHEPYKRKQGLQNQRGSVHLLRGGADATAKTGSAIFSIRDTIESNGQGKDQQEKDEDIVSDDERLSSQSVNARIIDPITTSIVIRDRINGSSFHPTNESIHTFIPKANTDILVDRKVYKNEQQDSDSEQDPIIPCTYIAETNLPTDIGMFRLRAYRVDNEIDFLKLEKNKFFGTEPCVIYSSEKSPFGIHGQFASGLDDAIPVRIHDQCVTSEVFRSKRYEI